METVVKELTQLESDLYWFAKGHYPEFDSKAAVEGDHMNFFDNMLNLYHRDRRDHLMVLVNLVAKILMDEPQTEKAFAEFIMYFHMAMRKKSSGNREVNADALIAESMNTVLAKWNFDEDYYAVKKPSWWRPKKKKGEEDV